MKETLGTGERHTDIDTDRHEIDETKSRQTINRQQSIDKTINRQTINRQDNQETRQLIDKTINRQTRNRQNQTINRHTYKENLFSMLVADIK